MIKAQCQFMEAAINEALQAKAHGDYAVGTVMVQGGKIVATAGNCSKEAHHRITHAESLAIMAACDMLGTKHLNDCVLYTTHEPCPMCRSLAIFTRLGGILYGARMSDMKAYREVHAHLNSPFGWRTIDIPCTDIIARTEHHIEVTLDFFRQECINLFHS